MGWCTEVPGRWAYRGEGALQRSGGVVGSPEEDEDCCAREEMRMGCFGEMRGESECSRQMGRGVRCI